MTVLTRSAALLVLLNVLAVSSAQAQTVDAQELARLQGNWVMVAGTVDGKPVDAEAVKKNRMTYSGSQISLQFPHQSSETIVATVTKRDAKPAPRQMDFVRKTGPSAGTTIQAIYEFQAPDTYRICFNPTGTRPTGFTCRFLHTWQRAKTP